MHAGDARRIAAALRDAAAKLHALADLARREQDRRAAVRAWQVKHEAWERDIADDNPLTSLMKAVTGDGEPKPPDLDPIMPDHVEIDAPPVRHRGQMGVSSARPDDLDRFAQRSRSRDHQLGAGLERLDAVYHAFESENEWGTLHAYSLLSAYGRYIDGNAFTARWVAQIAEAFRRAGGDGRLVRLPDRAIRASLRGAGLDHRRRSVTFDEPVAFGMPSTTGYANDPVNTATGNFVEVEMDLACSGLVGDMGFERTYNSRSGRVGAFGRGWSSWAGVRLLAGPDGVRYLGPDGQEALFARIGDGFGRAVGVDALVDPLASGLALCWFDGRRWVFDDAGLLVGVGRGPGTEVVCGYDGGRLMELAHAGGRWVRLEWDGERVAGLMCSDGRAVSHRYDAAGNLVEVDGDRGRRRYELDGEGRVVSVVDGDGVVELVNVYDGDGRVLEQLSPLGRRTYLSYLPGRVTVTTDEQDGPVNTFIHDAAGRLLAVIDGGDRQLSMVYDDWGNVVSLTERDGAVTVQEYDGRARPVRRVLPTGAALTFAYDDTDRLVEVAASTGAVTRYRYDGQERSPVEIVDAEDGVTRQIVRGGLVRRTVDPDGVAIDFDFDADGNLVAATDGEGNVARLERDAAGRVTATVSPLGRRVTVFYDDRGQITERHDPGGGVWRYEHTAAGRPASVTDPTGAREETRYGEHGRVAATVDALGHVTAYEHDAFGNLAGVVECDGARWSHEYDMVMRPTASVDPTGARWAREYDANGTLVATVDPVGVRVSASTDAFGRVISIGDSVTAVAYEYDELDRVIAELRPDGSTTRYGYDRCDRRTSIEDATGAITRLEYTPGGRIACLRYPSGRVETFEYDACGRLAARVDGAGRRREYRYDADGEYHYAANNTFTLSDSLGLHPLTERELKALRDRMDRNWGHHLADAGKWIGENAADAATWAYNHPGEVGAGLGGLGLLVGSGPVAIGLGIAGGGLGLLGARKSFRHKDWVGLGLDAGGMFPAIGGLVEGVNAIGAGGRAVRAAGGARTAAHAADDAVRSGTIKAGQINPSAVKASHLQNEAEKQVSATHGHEQWARRWDRTSVGLGGISAARTQLLPRIGLEQPPWILPAVSALLPPPSLSHAQ